MSIRVTHIRMSVGGTLHEHITDYRWVGYEDGEEGQSTRQKLVDWIAGEGGVAYVESAASRVLVGVVNPTHGHPYLRTYANETWTDNLLSLPRF